MPSINFENSSIWKNTLSREATDTFPDERDSLRAAFLSTREKISHLVSRINATLPGLTQHEISHLDSLWETASLLVGDSFQLNPLEGYILGCSFLIHDSALCFEAYERGQAGLRETQQWKDAFAEIKESKKDLPEEKAESEADFAALRNLHASEAEKLLARSWSVGSSDKPHFLIDDATLRSHLGKLIGEISASHHWDIEKVITTLPEQVNAPTSLPREWRINARKLAFILRCADAIHIDNTRAPDFLHALLKRGGVSYDHWNAQNRLSKVDLDQSDTNQQTLLFTSSIAFSEKDVESWYVAYDAICIADKELSSCNAALEQMNLPTFKVKKIKGVESPEQMAKNIKTDGWMPRSAKVHVGNVERIIENLGGEMLYGHGNEKFGIVLREMIQNARDGVRAREEFDHDFQPRILVKMEVDGDEQYISIEDNGIGMSERVLTGPLLDFGTSFWSSSLVKAEFPGLRSSKFKAIGRFGIGFYSVFMIAETVEVASRKYVDGLNEVRQLAFSSGLTLRPVFKIGAPQGFGTSTSTKVKIKLKPGELRSDLTVICKSHRLGIADFFVPLSSFVSAICAGLDVSVYFQLNQQAASIVHTAIQSPSFNLIQWLTNISFADHQPFPEIPKKSIELHGQRLRKIEENGRILGYAAINCHMVSTPTYLSQSTVGGLSTTNNLNPNENFVGYIDHYPNSAKREISTYSASPQVVKEWAQDQMQILKTIDLKPSDRYFAASSLCHFKVDPSEIASISIYLNGSRIYKNLEDLADLALSTPIAFLFSDQLGAHIDLYNDINNIAGNAIIAPLSNGSFLSLETVNNIPKNNFSILDCLYRSIISRDYRVSLFTNLNIGINRFGQQLSAIIIKAEKKS